MKSSPWGNRRAGFRECLDACEQTFPNMMHSGVVVQINDPGAGGNRKAKHKRRRGRVLVLDRGIDGALDDSGTACGGEHRDVGELDLNHAVGDRVPDGRHIARRIVHPHRSAGRALDGHPKFEPGPFTVLAVASSVAADDCGKLGCAGLDGVLVELTGIDNGALGCNRGDHVERPRRWLLAGARLLRIARVRGSEVDDRGGALHRGVDLVVDRGVALDLAVDERVVERVDFTEGVDLDKDERHGVVLRRRLEEPGRVGVELELGAVADKLDSDLPGGEHRVADAVVGPCSGSISA